MRVAVTPRSTQFAGVEVFTNTQGRGLFTRRADGSHQQHTGTAQTPAFRDRAHLTSWLRRHYPSLDQQVARELARTSRGR